MFRGSGSILLGNPIFLWFFREVRTPCPPSGSAHGMQLKEWTCLKCSFQRVVIIGRKVGLDYNSWYACLPLIRHVGWSSGCKLWSRETARCLYTNLLFWLGFLKYRNTMFGSVNQSLLPMRTQKSNLLCASTFVRQSRTFHSINALRIFYRMHTFGSILNIRIMSQGWDFGMLGGSKTLACGFAMAPHQLRILVCFVILQKAVVQYISFTIVK